MHASQSVGEPQGMHAGSSSMGDGVRDVSVVSARDGIASSSGQDLSARPLASALAPGNAADGAGTVPSARPFECPVCGLQEVLTPVQQLQHRRACRRQ
eukprot:361208-Chlamydomonas_euryale.AAC.7